MSEHIILGLWIYIKVVGNNSTAVYVRRRGRAGGREKKRMYIVIGLSRSRKFNSHDY